MRILVTGATGFLGGAAARHLAALGHDVLGLGRDPRAGAALARDGVPFRPLDLADLPALREVARGRDAIVHSAALSAPWGREADFHRANVVGTEHVVDAALAADARLVHISTPSLYHTGQDRLDLREDDLAPRPLLTPYARSKALAEDAVRAATGLRAVILRPRALYGPGDTTLLPRVVRALATGWLPVIGPGDTVGDLTYIDNAAHAIALACDPAAPTGTYNVSNGEPVRLWDQIRRLARDLDLPAPRGRVPKSVALAAAAAVERLYARFRPGAEPPFTRYALSVVSTSMTLDLYAIRRDLGYRPLVSTADGVGRFVAWVHGTAEGHALLGGAAS